MDALLEACNGPHLHQEMEGGLKGLLKGLQLRDWRPLMALLFGRLTRGQVKTYAMETVSSNEWVAVWCHCLYHRIGKPVENMVIGR